MAYTVEQSTIGVQGAADELIYVVKDTTNTSQPKYRYVCRVQVGGSTVIKLKQLPNNSNAAVFNIQDIARTLVYPDENPYSLGSTDLDGTLDTTRIFAQNSNALKEVSLRFGYEFAANDESAPAETLLPATDKEVSLVNGSFLRPGDSYPLSTSAAVEYKMTGGKKLFLSDSTLDYPVMDDGTLRSRAVLCFLNGNDVGSTGSKHLHISYYNGPTALNSGYISNTAANGGAAPATSLSDAQSLLYVGIGPFNLASQSIDGNLRPQAAGNAGWTHYDVRMASSTTLSGNETSDVYRFFNMACSKYFRSDAGYTLHWWNSKGGVDSLPCTGKSVRSDSMERSEYRVSGGNGFNADGSPAYVNRSYEGGKRTSRVRTTTSFQLSVHMGSPDILTPLVQSLMRSERVYMSGNGNFNLPASRTGAGLVQVVMKDTSVEYLEGVNDQAVTYVFNVEISRYTPYT